MALVVQSELTDDIDGSPADETVRFALDGVDFEIDLARGNAVALRRVMAPYIRAARRVQALAREEVVMHRVEAPYDARAVRAWASARRIKLPPRGRIPESVIEEYRAAGY